MTDRPPPTIAKWPFIAADLAILVVSAWAIQAVMPLRGAITYVAIIFAIIAWMVGAFLCVWPFLLEFKTQTRQFENESLTSALDQLQRLEEVGARVQTASASWQSAHDSAVRVVASAREVEEKIKADSKDFMDFAERLSNDEKNHLRLEVEKLRRAEAEWLQVAARILDHTFAITQAAHRSGQPNLANQMNAFQNACRDAARRVGLIPFHPAAGEAFDERSHQLEEQNAAPPEGAVISETLATGFTFQGQLLRRALVRVVKPEPERQVTGPVEETAPPEQPQETPAEAPVERTEEPSQESSTVTEPPPAPDENPERPESAEWNEERLSEPLGEVAAQADESPSPQGEGEVTEPIVSEETIVEVATAGVEVAAETPVEAEMQRPRRQRKPDPQTNLPF